jgi:MFS family permease
MAAHYTDDPDSSDGSDKPLLSPAAVDIGPRDNRRRNDASRLATLLSAPGRFQRRLLVFAGATQLADAMELTMIAFLAGEIKCPWGLSNGDMTLLQTLVLLAMGVGSNLVGWISDRLGRRPATAVSITAATLGGVVAAFSPSFAFLVACRVVVGFGVGAAPAALTLYTDFLPTLPQKNAQAEEQRGRKLILFFAFFSVGAVLESLVAWATLSMPAVGWRGLLVVSAVPSVLLALALPWVPESPRWLLDRGEDPRDVERARAIMNRIERINDCGAQRQHQLPHQRLHQEDSPNEDEETGKDLVMNLKNHTSGAMFESAHERNVFATLSLLFFLMASLYYSIVLVGASVLDHHHRVNSNTTSQHCVGPHNRTAPPHTTGEFASLVVTNSAEVPGLLVAYLLLDRIGRKRTIQVFFLACGAFCAVLWYVASRPTSSDLMWVTILVFGARGSALGFNQSLWIYTSLSDAFRVGNRTRVLGFTTSMARVGSLLAPALVTYLFAGAIGSVAAVCVAISGVSLLVVTALLPKH